VGSKREQEGEEKKRVMGKGKGKRGKGKREREKEKGGGGERKKYRKTERKIDGQKERKNGPQPLRGKGFLLTGDLK
jgi:hypothetical protein